MIDQQHGTWGEKIVTQKTPFSITTVLFLKPNKRCSWHFHETAYNQFFVIKGKLGVKTEIGPDDKTSLTTLTEKQVFTVQPGIYHEFQTYDEPTIIEEIAYVSYNPNDIYRKELGGEIEHEE